ncbi:hypothetical protein AKJ51_00810 [candidate division MSBL1 archaeon SCGC-AAA382A20]|uniref:Uncharacterized protein n=1 Tax=candidate division MSBL1 archaeon SCGC-AAA382A20 TaxID=1698280 RepID=A0A133VMK5_9EURY|nr:hypothetical protein AKJ51_00810 [candidate division MSBL1 archaeon SCGC-AAA382A20]
MTTKEKTLTAEAKTADCEPPPQGQLRAENENLRTECARLRKDNEKLTEIFEFARREFEKKDEETRNPER